MFRKINRSMADIAFDIKILVVNFVGTRLNLLQVVIGIFHFISLKGSMCMTIFYVVLMGEYLTSGI